MFVSLHEETQAGCGSQAESWKTKNGKNVNRGGKAERKKEWGGAAMVSKVGDTYSPARQLEVLFLFLLWVPISLVMSLQGSIT